MDVLWALTAIFGGAIAGVVFFGGLWWTVKRGVNPASSVLLWVVSLAARAAFVVGTFYVISDHRWERIVLCLAGFTVARLVIVQVVKRQLPTAPMTHGETLRAPIATTTAMSKGADACA